ncbi:hypothetical protein COB21_05575, partial [Candidatus Aerophobetes bacterium]
MPWLIWTFGVLFLFYKFFIQNFVSLISNSLMQQFFIGAAGLGALSSAFYIAYSMMQIPIGVLMDRFGARFLLATAAALSGIGCLIFSMTNSYSVAIISRAFMGIGSSFGFIGMAYISSHWFSKKRLPLLLGLGNSLGMLGSVCAGGPFAQLLNSIPWNHVILLFGVFGILIGIGIIVFLRKEKQSSTHNHEKVSLKHSMKVVACNKSIWLNGVIALLFYVTTTGFAGLWGVPFFQNVYGLDARIAGWAVSMLFFGWIVGGPIIGMMANTLHSRKKLQFVSILITFLCMVIIIYFTHISTPILFALMFAVGVFSSAELLSFALSVEAVPFNVKGTSMAITNCIISFGSFAVQPLVG